MFPRTSGCSIKVRPAQGLFLEDHITPAMAGIRVLVLIPDSTRKRKGSMAGAPGPGIADALPAADLARLVALRRKVATAAELPLASDIDPASKGKVDLMPAYLRYDGNMYRYIPREAWESRAAGVEVAIVSALSGLVLSRQPIRMYRLPMQVDIPGLGSIHALSREHDVP